MSRDKGQSSVLGCRDSKYTMTSLGVQRRTGPGFGVNTAKARGRCVVDASAQEELKRRSNANVARQKAELGARL